MSGAGVTPGADFFEGFSAFDPSRALAGIESWDESGIVARTGAGIGPYLLHEAMAQACGMHLRRLHGFAVRAFLASVSELRHEPGLGGEALTVRAALVSRTSAGAAYDVAVDGGPACRMLMGFTTLDRPDTFFRERFEALCTPS